MTAEEDPKQDDEADAVDPVAALRDLPVSPPTTAHDRRLRGVAREEFVRSFDDRPWSTKMLGGPSTLGPDRPLLATVGGGGVSRAAVPIALATVVACYLFWAFAVAISLNQ